MYAGVGLTTVQLDLEATPGTTCIGQVMIKNTSDTVERIRITVVAPPAFQLLSHLPPALILPPHSSITYPLKFFVNRNWTTDQAIVLVEAYRNNKIEVESSVRFTVRQRENTGRPQFMFSLVNENPYVGIDQDTVLIELRMQNFSFQPHTLGLLMHSLPDGFQLAPTQITTVTLAARQDTLLKIPCLAFSLHREQAYQIAFEMQDVTTKAIVGIVICKPVLLASTKRIKSPQNPNHNQGFSVMVGYGSLGQGGSVQELSAWGHQSFGKGALTFNTHLLSFSAQGYRELRDTYLQYEQDTWQLRLGSIYDYHELLLNGTGIKGTYITGDTRVEAWAINNSTNLIRPRSAPVADRTYSLRVSGQIPVTANLYYTVSSSHYSLQRSNRSGLLHFGKLDWLLSPQSRLKFTVGQSTETGRLSTNRNQTNGWSVGSDYTFSGEKINVSLHTYFSNPDYGGLQRGASLVDYSFFIKPTPNTLLRYRFSRTAYDQRLFTSENNAIRRSSNSTITEVSALQRFKSFSVILRPYYWYQSLTDPALAPAQSQSYRAQATLRYESEAGRYAELGLDGGIYKSPLFQMPVFRLNGLVGTGAFNLFTAYQHGPYQINDQQMTLGNPRDLRQFIVAPSYQYALLDKKIRGDAGFSANYSTALRVWSGYLRHSLTYAINETLQFNAEISVNSYAAEITELKAIAWQNTQLRLTATKTFLPVAKQATHNLSVRFYEDSNGNKQKEEGERWMEGLVVNINGIALITNGKGMAVCKGLPPGLAIVKTQCKISSGEAVVLTDSVQLVKSTQRDIAVRKTYTVPGQLICNLTKYGDKICELNAFQVEARNSLDEVFRTYSDEMGMFKLFLPPGQFTIRVTNSFDPTLTVARPVTYTVSPSTGNESTKLRIEVENNNRPIKVKRFAPMAQSKPDLR